MSDDMDLKAGMDLEPQLTRRTAHLADCPLSAYVAALDDVRQQQNKRDLTVVIAILLAQVHGYRARAQADPGLALAKIQMVIDEHNGAVRRADTLDAARGGSDA